VHALLTYICLLLASFVLAATYFGYSRMLKNCTYDANDVTPHYITVCWIAQNKQGDDSVVLS